MAPPIIRRPPVGRGAAKPSIGRGIGRGIRPPSTSSPPPPPEPHATAQPSEPFANDDDEDDDVCLHSPPPAHYLFRRRMTSGFHLTSSPSMILRNPTITSSSALSACGARRRNDSSKVLSFCDVFSLLLNIRAVWGWPAELEEMEKKREQQRLARIELEKKMEAEKAEAGLSLRSALPWLTVLLTGRGLTEADLTGDDIYRRRALMSGAGDTSLPSTGDGPQTGEEAFLLRQRLSERSAAATSADDDDTSALCHCHSWTHTRYPCRATPAMRMMSKMGWTGQGLSQHFVGMT